MEGPSVRPAVPADVVAVAELLVAVEVSLYGATTYSQADLEDEWTDLALERDTRVVPDGDRILGYGAVSERGERWRVEGFVHPAALGRGLGRLIATELEEEAARGGARRLQSRAFERDTAGRGLIESLGYSRVRVFREMRIELDAPSPPPVWPDGFQVAAFDPERDGPEFHAAQQEAFLDHWESTPRDFEHWSKTHLLGARFDPTLWCVVRAVEEIAAGTICMPDTYSGGWVQALFTRRPWRRRGLGAALLQDAFGRFWARGERSIGLGVDAASETGAFRLYERAGMAPALGFIVYEKELRAAG